MTEKPLHTLTATISPGQPPHLQLTCHGSDDSECRQARWCGVCDEGGCDQCKRSPLKKLGYCIAIEWIEGYEVVTESYGGAPDEPLRSGPVRLWWDGDNWLWAYLDKEMQ